MTHFSPIPNFAALRAGKPGYEDRFEIDEQHRLHDDPLVDLRDFEPFRDAKSYYANPNKMTGEALPGVPDAPLVREDIANRLVLADTFLRTDESVVEVLGAPARLRIADALRPFEVQKFAFSVAWPQIIRSMQPNLSNEEVMEQVVRYCADPGDRASLKPTPHLTGGAVDVKLINLESGKGFDRGHSSGKVAGTAYPDFHEGYHLTEGESDIVNSPEQALVAAEAGEVVLGRRVLYHAMTKIAGLHVNPHEIWHYGLGDPLSAYVSGGENPYYDIAKLPEKYKP